MDLQALKDKILDDAVGRYRASCGDALVAVVLYGPAAHGDFYEGDSDLHLLLVVRDLELGTLARLAEPLAWWLKKRQPMPRVFSRELIRKAADVFPMELSDLVAHRVVLWGEDPMPDLEVDRDHLRLQCEREIREKMMRLREAYIETGGKDKHLTRLMAESFASFVLIFRGALRLRPGFAVPQHDRGVVDAFAGWAGIDVGPFHLVEGIKKGNAAGTSAALFSSYYSELTKAVDFIDGFVHHKEATP